MRRTTLRRRLARLAGPGRHQGPGGPATDDDQAAASIEEWLAPGSGLLDRADVRAVLARAAAVTGVGPPGAGAPGNDAGAAVDEWFHQRYYAEGERTWRRTAYRSVPIHKCVTDLWVYLELVASLRPDLIVESRASAGGTALLLADLCQAMDHGRVVAIGEEDRADWPAHQRVSYLHGAPLDPVIVRKVGQLVGADAVVLVILDSSVVAHEVRAELEAYAPLVSVGSYVIVERTNVHGHPVRPDLPEGPMEAVAAFVAASSEFEIDGDCERYGLTFNPSGYLRRVRPPADPEA